MTNLAKTTIQTIFASSQAPLLRVLILNHQWLIGAAIASLLSKEQDMELAGLTPPNALELPEIADKFALDAVVVDNLMASGAEIRTLCTAFNDHPTVNVFVICMEANVVHLNGVEMAAITQARDLAALIRRNHGQASDCIQTWFDADV